MVPPDAQPPATRPPWRALGVLLSLVGILAVALLLTRPLRPEGALFSLSFHGDGATSPWFHSFVAHSLAQGAWPRLLTDFGFPHPVPVADAFATLMDAVLLAPLEILPWPDRWGWTLTATAFLNGASLALLSRALGCGPLGVACAFLLALAHPPAWHEMAEGRTNSMAPALPALSLALLRFALQSPARKTPWTLVGQGVLGAGAGLAGAAACLWYPPSLVLWMPVLPLVLLSSRPLRTRWVPLLASALAGSLCLPGAWDIWMHPTAHYAPQAGACPDPALAMAVEDLFRLAPPATGLTFPWLNAIPWGLALAGLLASSKAMVRWPAWVGAWGAALAFLSTGPCVLLQREPAAHLLFRGWAVGVLERLHAMDRLGAVGGMMLGLAAAWGLEILAGLHGAPSRPGWGRASWGVAALLLALLTWDAARLAGLAERVRTPWTVPPAARFLAARDDGGQEGAAELPWDGSIQFASAIALHGPRANPLRPSDRPPAQDLVLNWLDGMGRGDLSLPPPTRAQLQSRGLRWIFLESGRCRGPRVPREACSQPTLDALSAVLGPPQERPGPLLVWDLSP